MLLRLLLRLVFVVVRRGSSATPGQWLPLRLPVLMAGMWPVSGRAGWQEAQAEAADD